MRVIIVALLCLANTSKAQDTATFKLLTKQIMQSTHQYQNALKQTAVKKRLKNYSYYYVDPSTQLQIRDSNICYYGNAVNGSSFDFNTMDYDVRHDVEKIDKSPLLYWRTDIMADSNQTYRTVTPTVPLSLRGAFINKFNQNGSVVEFNIRSLSPAGSPRYTFQYDGQNRPIEVRYYQLDGNGNWIEQYKRILSYDNQNRVTGDTIYPTAKNYKADAAFVRTYNGGNLEQLVYTGVASNNNWMDVNKYEFTYYPNGLLKTSAFIDLYGPNSVSDSFGYEPGISFYTYRNSSFSGIERKHLNNSGLPDTVYHSAISFDAFTYDSHGNPIHSEHYSTMSSTPKLEYIENYYYEDYFDTDVEDVNNNRYAVYPNPVANELTIDGEPGTKVSIQNVLGQEVYKTVLQMSKEVLDISQLAHGRYLLQLTDTQARRSVIKVEKL